MFIFISQLGHLLPPNQWVFPLQISCHQSCPHHQTPTEKLTYITLTYMRFHFSNRQKLLQIQFLQSESLNLHFMSFQNGCYCTLLSSRLCRIHPVCDAKVVAMLTDTLATLEDNTRLVYVELSTLISPLASTTNAKSLERILHKLSESQTSVQWR